MFSESLPPSFPDIREHSHQHRLKWIKITLIIEATFPQVRSSKDLIFKKFAAWKKKRFKKSQSIEPDCIHHQITKINSNKDSISISKNLISCSETPHYNGNINKVNQRSNREKAWKRITSARLVDFNGFSISGGVASLCIVQYSITFFSVLDLTLGTGISSSVPAARNKKKKWKIRIWIDLEKTE